jgi:hypothetical protein
VEVNGLNHLTSEEIVPDIYWIGGLIVRRREKSPPAGNET